MYLYCVCVSCADEEATRLSQKPANLKPGKAEEVAADADGSQKSADSQGCDDTHVSSKDLDHSSRNRLQLLIPAKSLQTASCQGCWMLPEAKSDVVQPCEFQSYTGHTSNVFSEEARIGGFLKHGYSGANALPSVFQAQCRDIDSAYQKALMPEGGRERKKESEN